MVISGFLVAKESQLATLSRVCACGHKAERTAQTRPRGTPPEFGRTRHSYTPKQTSMQQIAHHHLHYSLSLWRTAGEEEGSHETSKTARFRSPGAKRRERPYEEFK